MKAALRNAYLVILLGLSLISLFSNRSPIKILVFAAQEAPPSDIQIWHDEKGVPMVYVPSGVFIIGQTVEEYIRLCTELNQDVPNIGNLCQQAEEFTLSPHSRNIEAFYIDQYEVSRQAYSKCIEARVCNDDVFKEQPQEPLDVPIQQVSYYDGAIYCAWRNARIPTEAEWEYAARGTNNLSFPWGNEFNGSNANFCDTNCPFKETANDKWDDGYSELAPIQTFGQSWVGAYNLAGNVAEWTSSTDGTGSETQIFKGGDYTSSPHQLASWVRFRQDPETKNDIIGFRCARSILRENNNSTIEATDDSQP